MMVLHSPFVCGQKESGMNGPEFQKYLLVRKRACMCLLFHRSNMLLVIFRSIFGESFEFEMKSSLSYRLDFLFVSPKVYQSRRPAREKQTIRLIQTRAADFMNQTYHVQIFTDSYGFSLYLQPCTSLGFGR